MQQWEYKFENIHKQGPLEVGPDNPLSRDRWYAEQLQKLNDLGAAGWELICVLDSPLGYKRGDMILKRPKAQSG